MKVNHRSLYALLGIVLMALVWGCSPNQNTISADVFHNTTAHYNGYFYAREKTREVEKIILKSLDDDPNNILRLFPRLDTVLAKSYRKDTEEIIKMASISIQRHPNSKWVDDDYVLVGLARLYDCNFPDAIQTFKYVNTKSQDANLRHKALVHLIRTFTEQGEYAKAEEAFQFLEKEKLNPVNAKNLHLEKAYYYQVRSDYDNMVHSLTTADSLLTHADRKGRIYFIIGQVYQKLGFGAEAYNYYRKCLATNPDYEIDFYARLNLAQVARLDNSRNVKVIRNQFEKLLKDAKNQEFKDKIYYELGEFERKQGNVTEALAEYKLSAHAGKNKRIQGNAYLRIGQLYFDSLKRFSVAKAYYDSALKSLPAEVENYDAIKKRHEVLGDFVKYTETIQWQDSLLWMASIDTSALHHHLDSVFARKEAAEDGKKKKRKKSTGSSGPTNQNSTLFQTESTSTTDWYFDNPSAIASGQQEFQRIWGDIQLEDNWRRSSKTSTSIGLQQTQTQTNGSLKTDALSGTAQTVEAKKMNPATEAFRKILPELPKTAKQREEAYAKIEEAYFKLGDLYYFKLAEKENALASYEKLLERFPETALRPEILYKIYLIHKERPDARADAIAGEIKEKYPESTYAKILLNPNYLKETSVAQEKQKMIYKEAYLAFQQNNLRLAQEKLRDARAVGETSFTPQLDMLQILIVGKTEDVTRYQYELGEFSKKYPKGELHTYAETLLASAKTFVEKTERAKGIRFSPTFDEPHYFVLVHRIQDKASTTLSNLMEKFNRDNYRVRKLETTNLIFNDTYSLTFVGFMGNRDEALEYLERFNRQFKDAAPFSTLNFHNFVITKENFNIFYRNKALDEYLSFFDRHYQKTNP